MKRCFVGFRIDAPARARLAELQAELRRLPPSAARRLKLEPAENLHATVRFLGPTGDAQVADVVAALAAAARGLTPREVVLQGFAAFPSSARPRVLFAAVSAGRELVSAAAAAADDAVEPLGFPREDRPFTPHVTIARADQPSPDGPLSAWLSAAPREALGHIVATSLVLFESHLGPSGSRHDVLAEVPLGG
jgi:2'-5' RNA ligase